jgi:hypothetical protein
VNQFTPTPRDGTDAGEAKADHPGELAVPLTNPLPPPRQHRRFGGAPPFGDCDVFVRASGITIGIKGSTSMLDVIIIGMDIM